MGMSRNQRRLASQKRRNLAVCDAANTAKLKAKAAVIRGNVKALGKAANSRPHVSAGLVSSLYTGAGNPVGFTRPLRYSKGAANVGTI